MGTIFLSSAASPTHPQGNMCYFQSQLTAAGTFVYPSRWLFNRTRILISSQRTSSSRNSSYITTHMHNYILTHGKVMWHGIDLFLLLAFVSKLKTAIPTSGQLHTLTNYSLIGAPSSSRRSGNPRIQEPEEG